jgi:hypothetical protein
VNAGSAGNPARMQGKRRGKEERVYNRMIRQIRAAVEHILVGVKRVRIVKERFRNTKPKFADLVNADCLRTPSSLPVISIVLYHRSYQVRVIASTLNIAPGRASVSLACGQDAPRSQRHQSKR